MQYANTVLQFVKEYQQDCFEQCRASASVQACRPVGDTVSQKASSINVKH